MRWSRLIIPLLVALAAVNLPAQEPVVPRGAIEHARSNAARWMAETKTTEVLVLTDLALSPNEKVVIASFSPPKTRPRSPIDAYWALDEFQEVNTAGESLIIRSTRKIAGFLGVPARKVEFKVKGFDYPGYQLLSARSNYGIAFAEPDGRTLQSAEFPSPKQFSNWFVDRYKVDGGKVSVLEAVREADGLYFESMVENLLGKVINGSKYHEKLQVIASLHQERARAQNALPAAAPTFYLRVIVDGWYAPGLAGQPRQEDYLSMEPKYASVLSTHVKKIAAEFGDAIQRGLPKVTP